MAAFMNDFLKRFFLANGTFRQLPDGNLEHDIRRVC